VAALFLATSGRDLRILAWFLLPLAGSVVAVWVLAGQPIPALVGFFAGSFDLSAGFSTAMGTEGSQGDRGWEYAAAAVLLGLMLLSAVHSTPHMRHWRRWALISMLAMLLFFAYKHGFVRHDAHSVGFFAVTSLIAFGVVSASRHRTAPALLLTTSLVSFVWSSGIAPVHLDALTHAGQTAERVSHVARMAARSAASDW